MEETMVNMIIMELEMGPPKLRDRLEARLKDIKDEEMRAIRIMMEEDRRMERLEYRDNRKKIWAERWKDLQQMLESEMDWLEDCTENEDVEMLDIMTPEVPEDAMEVEEESGRP